MKRKIVIRSPGLTITALIQTPLELIRAEVEEVRDQLADRLQEAAADLKYLKTPRNRVQVR